MTAEATTFWAVPHIMSHHPRDWVLHEPWKLSEELNFFPASGRRRSEGEEIEILEPTLDEALAMIDNGEIINAKAFCFCVMPNAPVSGAAMKCKVRPISQPVEPW